MKISEIMEMTTSGSVASVSMPLGKTRKRKGDQGVYEGEGDLAQRIKSGETVEVADASFVRGQPSMGDLEKLGWAKKHRERNGMATAVWWEYTGPGSIMVNGQVLKGGGQTEPVDVDYS